MSFFSRPNLEDLQFKQTEGSILSLSGQTRIKTWTGLTLTDGAGGDVIITASGASSATTEGYVLTYMDGSISLKPSSASGGTYTFDTDRATTRSGIPSVCVGGECTINNFIETYFFPAVGVTSSLSIATGGATREFGDSTTGLLCYNANRETNPICLVEIWTNPNDSISSVLVSNCIAGSTGGTVSYTLSSNYNCTGIASASDTYCLHVEDSAGCSSTSTASITWRNKTFSFKSSTLYSDSTVCSAFPAGTLSSSIAKTLSNESFSNQFYYYAYPAIFGTPTFTVNGLPNNAWGSSSAGTLFSFNYTNSNGYTIPYYVARSDNRITGNYNINIS